ncbi:MAG: glycosyltransferase family 2 protein [Pyrinomonadaceae bacterium]|nr:glycosyltransferase family 2 protein [Pyrinomonadaceae bacterium]
MKISASIIVFNEEHNIEELCQTVSWCDEIVIVDSYSADKTAEIAEKYTDKVFQHEFKGYKDKHEFADSQTTGDWIFWIDADERVTPELKESILKLKELKESDLPDGFKIARKTWYLGRWINHSGWYPDFQMRLYRKSSSYWDGVSPHETARVTGKVEKLEGEFLHYTKRDLSEHQKVLDSYTSLAAEYLVKNGKSVGGFEIFINSISAFFRTYLLKQGFRDGIPGLIIAMFTAYSVFLKYAKVWEKNNIKE